ncbi:hypothetical protein AMB3_4396 [plant metagenome]
MPGTGMRTVAMREVRKKWDRERVQNRQRKQGSGEIGEGRGCGHGERLRISDAWTARVVYCGH